MLERRRKKRGQTRQRRLGKAEAKLEGRKEKRPVLGIVGLAKLHLSS